MGRETLNREQIVGAAIELLDAEGEDGLSMRKLGQRLGSAATAMYWHVGNKENLLALAADEVWHELPLPDPGALGWREAARRMMYDLKALSARHPWLMRVVHTHFAYGEGMARYQDTGYAIFEAAGFSGWELDHAVNTTSTFVIGTSLMDQTEASRLKERAAPGRDKGTETVDEAEAEALAGAEAIASKYPRLAARLAEHHGSDPAAMAERAFAYGVEAILDGLQTRLGPTPGR
ncbi:TetR/AcrR family transcriptional regulator C-terminal domain-containing protein [Streptomyces sp. NPDC000983]|uniref:TetR/AcrR family transcriptional regulator C-terminal domain-containing protein n=1 Tax=Streptomyces sp. NPDC000983 TaxID=3154373 RepID=UPI003330C694